MSAGHFPSRLGLGLIALLLLVPGDVTLAADAKEKQKGKPYPLAVCLVSDEKLGGMGEPHVIQYQDREIKFCCDHCEKDFRADTAKYIAKLDKAAKAATTQPSSQPAGGKAQHEHDRDH